MEILFSSDKERILQGSKDLLQMQDSWKESGGTAISQSLLEGLKTYFSEDYPKIYPQPYFFPRKDGGISVEWSLVAHDIVVEFDAQGKTNGMQIFDKNKNLHAFIQFHNMLDIAKVISQYL